MFVSIFLSQDFYYDNYSNVYFIICLQKFLLTIRILSLNVDRLKTIGCIAIHVKD